MSVIWNSEIITGIPLSGKDPLFEKLEIARDKGLVDKSDFYAAIMNLIDISPKITILPDTIFGILELKESGSGEISADDENGYQYIEELPLNQESYKKLVRILEMLDFSNYAEKIGTYKVVYFT